MSEDDLPRVAEWLRQPHIQEWWKDRSASEKARDKYLPRIHGAEPTEMFVLVFEGRAVGLIQRYRMRDHPAWAATIGATGMAFPDAAGIDYAIGEPELIGKGIGSDAVSAFTEAVFVAYPDIETIVVTPQAANRASCRVLEKAGYELAWTGKLDSDDPADAGPAAMFVRRRQAVDGAAP